MRRCVCVHNKICTSCKLFTFAKTICGVMATSDAEQVEFIEIIPEVDGKCEHAEEIDAFEEEIDVIDAVTESEENVKLLRALARIDLNEYMHYLCPRCGESFASQPLWQRHLDNKHFVHNLKMLPVTLTSDAVRYNCNKCERTFCKTDYRKILHHCFSHMPFNYFYKCAICEQTMDEKADMEQHIKRHIELHLLKAEIDGKVKLCDENAAWQFEVRGEQTNFAKYLYFVCPVCMLHMRRESNWLQHVEAEHQYFEEEKLNFTTIPAAADDDEPCSRSNRSERQCNTCGLQLASTTTLKSQIKHFLVHARIKPFRCGICKMRFQYQREIDFHIRLLHAKKLRRQKRGPTNFPASIDEEFDLHEKFFANEENHRKFMPHIHFCCPICKADFRELSLWHDHINANHEFFKRAYLLLDFADVDKKVSFCLTCNRRVKVKSHRSLWTHQLWHTPCHAFVCEICNISYGFLQRLSEHFRNIHTEADGTISTDRKSKRRKAADNMGVHPEGKNLQAL